MTFVGKILVIVIMAFSLLFLGISTVVFTTSKNWMAATKDEQEEGRRTEEKAARRPGGLGRRQEGARGREGGLRRRDQGLDEPARLARRQNKRNSTRSTAARKQLVAADADGQEHPGRSRSQASSRPTCSAAKVGRREAGQRVQAPPGRPERQDPRARADSRHATKNNSDLRERVAKFSTLLHQNGLSDDISQIKGLESPPPVMGEVKRVDPTNRRARDDHRLRRRPGRRPRAVPLPHQAPPRIHRQSQRSSRSIPTRPSPRWSATPSRARR